MLGRVNIVGHDRVLIIIAIEVPDGVNPIMANSSVSVNRDKWGGKTSSLNSSGKTSKCTICQSIHHWFRECPHRVETDSEEKQVNTLIMK